MTEEKKPEQTIETPESRAAEKRQEAVNKAAAEAQAKLREGVEVKMDDFEKKYNDKFNFDGQILFGWQIDNIFFDIEKMKSQLLEQENIQKK